MAETLSRREMIQKTSLTAGLGALGGVWEEKPKKQNKKRISPNEKLNIACIGVGGQGATDVNGVSGENIVALCDVDERRAAATFEKFPNAKRFQDYRELFDKANKEFDAVTVTIPDHSHAIATALALHHDKHVYCQKPLTHSVWEAREIANLAESKPRLATQMGTQGHAFEGYHRLVEIIQGGVIGDVREVHVWTDRPIWPQGLTRPTKIMLPPTTLNWELWIGPAAMRMYSPDYLPFVWRGWWDFGTGAMGDMACHLMDPVFWALGLGSPDTISAKSEGGTPDSPPLSSIIRYEFPKTKLHPGVAMTWYDGKNRPPASLLEGEKVPAIDNGSLYIGTKGKLIIDHFGMPILLPKAQFEGAKLPPPTIKRSPGHYLQWIEACKHRTPTGSNFKYAGNMTESVLLGNIALRVGRKILWDSRKLECKKDPEATALVRYEYRDEWSL